MRRAVAVAQTGSSASGMVRALIPGSSSQHGQVSLIKTLNSKLLPIRV